MAVNAGFRYRSTQPTSLNLMAVRFHLLLFKFNPYRGWEGFFWSPPGFTWGYSHSTPIGVGKVFSGPPQVSPGAIHIQPLSGLGNYVIALYFTQSGNAIDVQVFFPKAAATRIAFLFAVVKKT